MKWCIDMRLGATEKEKGEVALPRAVRLARRYNFSEDETLLYNYLLVDQLSLHSEFTKMSQEYSIGRVDLISLRKILDLPLLETLDFVNSEREHMSQSGILQTSQRRKDVISRNLQFDTEAFKSLIGDTLTHSEFLKVESMPLGEILAEEPGSKHFNKDLIKPAGTYIYVSILEKCPHRFNAG